MNFCSKGFLKHSLLSAKIAGQFWVLGYIYPYMNGMVEVSSLKTLATLNQLKHREGK